MFGDFFFGVTVEVTVKVSVWVMLEVLDNVWRMS